MGPPSYMWSVVDRNVVMRRMTMQHGTHSKTRPPPKPISRDLSEYSISPSPLDKKQAFTVTEENIRYRNGLEENARTSSGEDPAEFPSASCSTPQQYKADLICTARVQPQLQTRATSPSPNRRRR